MGGAEKDAEDVADAARLRIGQVIARAVALFEMGDMVERVDDEIDRHQIDAPALYADDRHPGRQRLTGLLDQLEEVIRAVDLVDLAGLGIAHHDPRTIDAPGNPALGADQLFRAMLAGEIRMVEAARLLEHVLAEDALIEARRGNRADVMKAARADRGGKLQNVPRALHIGPHLQLRIGFEIVDGGKVENVIDLAGQLLPVFRRHAKVRLADVSRNRDDVGLVGTPERSQCRDALGRGVAHEHVNLRARTAEQFAHKPLADKPARTCHKIVHAALPSRHGQNSWRGRAPV